IIRDLHSPDNDAPQNFSAQYSAKDPRQRCGPRQLRRRCCKALSEITKTQTNGAAETENHCDLAYFRSAYLAIAPRVLRRQQSYGRDNFSRRRNFYQCRNSTTERPQVRQFVDERDQTEHGAWIFAPARF